ncbi:MAG TPA: NUDIX hydrolase [Actinomycetota bacterium]
MAEPDSAHTGYHGAFVRVDVERWPGLQPWEVVRTHDAAGVLAVLPDERVVLVKQFRPAVRQVLTEIPAGLLDIEGEDALTTAGRELFEETGYRHTAIEFLGGYYPSAGSLAQYVHLFWARVPASPEGPGEAGIDVTTEPLERMIEAARSGRVRDGMTSLALLMAAGRPPLASPE